MYDFETVRLAFMRARKMKLSSLRIEMGKSFLSASLCTDLSISFSHCNFISFTVHVWCPPSHGRFSSYFLYLSASHSSVCMCLEKISRINVYSSDFSLPSRPNFMITWKIHLSCLISSIAWHFSSACQDTCTHEAL
jgi:hypothetical protein